MIIYAPRVLEDLRIIEAYLLERNPAAARRVLGQIKRTIEMLTVFPLLGIVVNDEGDRRLAIARYPYFVFYHGGKAIFSSIISGTMCANRLIRKQSINANMISESGTRCWSASAPCQVRSYSKPGGLRDP
jgi:plasmid stabilization system protein ParE